MTKRSVKEALQTEIRRLGHFPSLDEFSEALKLKPGQTKQVLNILAKDGYLIADGDNWQVNPTQKSREVSGAVTGAEQAGVVEPELVINDDAQDAVREAVETELPETPLQAMQRASETLMRYGEKAPNTSHLLNKSQWESSMENACGKAENWQAFWRKKLAAWKWKKNTKPPARKKPQSAAGVITFIRAVMGAIGIGAAAISMYYTSRFTEELFPYTTLAYLLSGIMIGFNVMAFELILLFGNGQATTHWFRWPAAFVFFLLWLVVGGFSITATVAGQYNQHAKNTMATAVTSGNPQAVAAKWQNITARKSVWENQIKNAQEQNSTLNNKLKDMKPDDTAYANTNWYITDNNAKIADANAKLNEIRIEEAAMLKEHPEVLQLAQRANDGGGVPDFYGFLARIFGATRDVIQFWVSLFPAVFVDLIAPIAAAAALFLRGKK